MKLLTIAIPCYNSLDTLLERTILAMRACEDEVGRQMEAYNA